MRLAEGTGRFEAAIRGCSARSQQRRRKKSDRRQTSHGADSGHSGELDVIATLEGER
jgi:hypothetical protein